MFTLAFQFAEPGDTTTDPTIAWPEQRSVLLAGQIIVTSRSSNEDHWQQQVFDPTRVTAGVDGPTTRYWRFGRPPTRCPRNAAKDKPNPCLNHSEPQQ